MHTKSLQFDAEYHSDIMESDTTSAFIAEMRALIGQSVIDGNVAVVELHFLTYSYGPEMVQQWVRMPADSFKYLESSMLFEVMVQAKPDGTIKVTHLRNASQLVPWCELLDCKPICKTCGEAMRPAGSCFVCERCGAVSGTG